MIAKYSQNNGRTYITPVWGMIPAGSNASLVIGDLESGSFFNLSPRNAVA